MSGIYLNRVRLSSSFLVIGAFGLYLAVYNDYSEIYKFATFLIYTQAESMRQWIQMTGQNHFKIAIITIILIIAQYFLTHFH
jgi:hypothetical protein